METIIMTDEQVQADLDALRAENPINGALQDLMSFIIHARENNGVMSPQNVLYLAAAAEQAVNMLMAELHRLADENEQLTIAACSCGPRSGRS